MSFPPSVGTWAGAAFLVLQAGLVLAARFTPARYFCWAPHTAQVQFQIEVHVAGRQLSQPEVWQRYGFNSRDWEAHAACHVMDAVRMYESSLGRDDNARITMHYRINGGDLHTWHWPER